MDVGIGLPNAVAGTRGTNLVEWAYLGDYFAFLGEEVAGYIVAGAKDAETVKQRVAAFDEAGCGELIFPSSSDPAQVDLFADAAGL